ncbi:MULTISPECIES: sugar porter family MFS transporter [unclassified Sphingobacterium]|uniref:sugar porter family MFS transporter n=1 Tax=unclassified Sphingobacterium TaxID=2609468 RepID=UPI001051AFC1|nr:MULTISPECIES: sugar porter family MFS transporter [unclassified Sphingobacterium]MCS3556238.1 sugar porter (SP) family MFS transporter [Sphingobacterium sp. JUb21]TCR08609.1 sugar porter (SP) family MFS transporter [Sphingobacterium sp. JUb20]
MKNVWKFSLIAALGGFLFGFETAVISGAEQIIQKLWQLDAFWHGLTVSISLIGTIVGAIVAGRFSERYGRKPVLSAIALLYLLSAVGCGASPFWSLFLLFRFLGGLAVGISSVVGPVYISEISPAKDRGKLTGLFQIMIVSGILVAYCTNFLFADTGDHAWRYMLAIMALPAGIFYVLLKKIPESPRWLALHRNIDEANAVFHTLGQPALTQTQQTENTRNSPSLWQKKYYKPIAFAVLLAFFNQMTGINAILYYAPRIFEIAGFEAQLSYLQPIFIGGTNVVFTFLGMSIIDKFGRKKLLLTGAVGMFIFLMLTAFGLKSGHSTYLLFYIIGFIGAFALSQGAVIWVFLAEIFPNEIRAKGSSLGSTTHWIFAAIISWIFPVIVEGGENGGFYIFLFYGIMVVLSFIFILFLPETKGKTLEGIDQNTN